jgi:NADH dehydrogenase
LFATLERYLPLMAIAAAETRFQPVFVGDVAHCFERALADNVTIGQRFPLCGPDVYTLRELVAFVGKLTGHERPILALGPRLGRLQARLLELVPGTPMSRDNLASMQVDSVCGCAFPAVFGIVPTALAAIAPTYLGPGATKSRYDAYRTQVGR